MKGIFKRNVCSKAEGIVHSSYEEEKELLQERKKPFHFNLFDPGAINNNLLLLGNSNGSSSKFFSTLIQQEHNQYPNLTSVIFTTSIEQYQELIDSNMTIGIFQLSEFKINPFESFDKLDAHYQAEHQANALINDMVKETGNDSIWTKYHNLFLRHQIQELINNSTKTPTMLRLYKEIYSLFLENGNILTGTFENLKMLEGLQPEVIDALDPFTNNENEVCNYFNILKKQQILQEILVVLSNFVRYGSYSEFFKTETNLPKIEGEEVIIIEVPQNYDKAHIALITYLTDFLTKSNVSKEGVLKGSRLMAIYHDIQCYGHNSLIVSTLRKCRRYNVGIRMNTINDKLNHDLGSNFSKYVVVQSENPKQHRLIEQFNLNKEECDNIQPLNFGESYVLLDNILLDAKFEGIDIEAVSKMHN